MVSTSKSTTAFISIFAATPSILSSSSSSSSFVNRSSVSLQSQSYRASPSRRVRAGQWFATAGTPPPPSFNNDARGDEEKTNENDDGSSPQRSDDGSRDSEFNLELSSTVKPEEANELFKFIQSIPPPELVKKFTESAPPVVQKAIRETLVSMLGSLPPLAFYTSVSSMSTNLVQLFHSTLITGYMFRNAAYRLELTRTLDVTGIKSLPSSENQEPEIHGGVVRFKQNDGSTIEVPVEEYIGELKQTVSNLKDELTRERKGGNELLTFVSTMDKDNLESLTKNASQDVIEAMKKVVDFVTTTQGIDSSRNAVVEASSAELGQLLFYLMVSGFFLREAEVRLDLQKQLGGESSLGNILEGGSGSISENTDTEPDSDPPSPSPSSSS